ncbi:Neuropeptide Y receptor [Toxocara canis]|uniref:Neuropeptide Y receptor n=1 Tax=Toxocara canis TaxID=6265 RepID=A0A0B2VVN8_TOXCA|nr:Neuropeptide Y receptor [Toxocara canis]
MKYAVWDSRWTLYVIAGIWIISGLLATPTFAVYDEILFALDPPNGTLVARLCISTQDETLNFIVVNLLLAFIVPFALISVFYTLIFITVSNHRSLAVDAHIRDERVKLRVAHMMLTVIIVFALCWLPLYGIYCYFFLSKDHETSTFQFASQVLRPIFQWLSLLSSSLNPLIYIAYSQKYRRAFHQLLLMPCRRRYERVRNVTRSTLRLRLTTANGNENGETERLHLNGRAKSICETALSPVTIVSTTDTPTIRSQSLRACTITSF